MAVDVTVLTYADALAAGFVSFASPCALALVPGYLSFVSGASYDELTVSGGTAAIRAGSVARATGAFVIGFAAMFTLWGAGAGYLGNSLSGDRDTINLVSGILLVLMGALMILMPRLSFLQGEKRLPVMKRPTTLAGVAVAGAAFAIAWTPCTGPFLGQVLSLAVPTESPRLGASLLFTYALGLGIPFLLAGLFLTQTMSVSRRVRDHWRIINLVAGIVTIALGILIATGRFTVITQKISSLGIGW
jgi:cytochrome c-type biogenesis protein